MGKIAKIIEDGLAQIMIDELNSVGRDTTALDDNDKIFMSYFTTCLLFPTPQKYYVHIHNDFVCPPECVKGFNMLLRKMQCGEKFSAHLSRITKATEKHDLMLYDWGIYHFHLGLKVDNDGYIKRTSKLLYTYITDNAIYLLGIFDHGKWNDQDLIEIIHKYYPWSIVGWRIGGKPEVVFNEEDHKKLREKCINTFVTLQDGTSYMGPGWGITAAGTSSKVRMQANDKHHECIYLEKEVLKKLPNSENLSWRVERNEDDIMLVNKEDSFKLYQWMSLRDRIEQDHL